MEAGVPGWCPMPCCFGGHPTAALVGDALPRLSPPRCFGDPGVRTQPLRVTSVGSFGIFSLWAFHPQCRAETCPARSTSAGVAEGAGSELGTPQIAHVPSLGPEAPCSALTKQLCHLIRLMTVLHYGKAADEFAPALGGAFPGVVAAQQIWGTEGDRVGGRGSREKGKRQQRSANPWKGGQAGHRATQGRC